MAIEAIRRVLYHLVCSTCGAMAEHDDGMPWYFESRDSAASFAQDNGWNGPWCLNQGIPVHCPACIKEGRIGE